MKKFFLSTWTIIAMVVFFFSSSFAQAPQGINYQAVLRDNAGVILANTPVYIRFSVHMGSAGGFTTYQETHFPTTNDYGLVTAVLGEGTPVTGTFGAINWGSNDYFLEVEADHSGGGYVGLGTTQLMSVPYALYAETSGSGGGSSQWTTSGNNIYYNTGNVGIGNTSPADLLSLSGGNRVMSFTGSTNNLDIRGEIKFYDPSYPNGWSGIRGWCKNGSDQSSLAFYTSYGTGAERMVIDEFGQVGIGTSSPSQLLDVAGNLNASAYLVNHGYGSVLEVGDDAWITDQNTGNAMYVIGQQNADRGTIRFGNGNYYGLDMYSNSNVAGFGGYTSSGSDGFTLWQQYNEGSGIHGDGDHVVICSPGDGNLVNFVDEDGGVLVAYVGNLGNYVQVSDMNLKQNFEPIENSLDKVLSLTGYTYEFKLRNGEAEKGQQPVRTTGVIAQELAKVLPEAAQVNDQGNYMVDYAAITPLLIQAIKEQQQIIEEMQSQIETLKNN